MSSKTLHIIKVGTTFPDAVQKLGDFDSWTATALDVPESSVTVIDIQNGAPLPSPNNCAGVVITGSHAMVTDKLPWSVEIEEWIPLLLDQQIPLLGICYGHQLLASAAGGKVGFHPHGKEIGTVGIHLQSDASSDPIFSIMPPSFSAHTTHAQTVLTLPDGAVHLASNDFEPHHAFRLGNCAWGVQFHPEYSADIMRCYIDQQAEELTSNGREVLAIMDAVQETPMAARLLQLFALFALSA